MNGTIYSKIYYLAKGNYTRLRKFSFERKLSVISLTILSLLSLALAITNPIKGQGLDFPATPPITPPVTPPITPTPTPTTTPPLTPPIVNQSPVITTKKLRAGRVGRFYLEAIRGYDINPGDQLTMTFRGLPPGIYLSRCITHPTNRSVNITCFVKGITTRPGEYNVYVTLQDNHGGVVQKVLSLEIFKLR